MIANIVKYEFFQNSFLIGIILGVLLPIIGVIVLLRRIPNIADAIGHINMSGITLAFFINNIIALTIFETFAITLLWSVLGAFAIEYFRSKYKNYKEVAIMVVYSIAIAISIIFMNLSEGFQTSFNNILFGNINTLTYTEVYLTVGISVIILLGILLNYKKMIILSIDEERAKLYGVKNRFQRYLIMIFLSISITIGIKMLGVLLVSSLILIPNLTAIRFAKSLKATFIYSIVFTEIAIILGIFGAYILNLATSAVIVIISIIIYLISLLIKRGD